MMEPVRVVLGAGMSLADAVRRLAAHESSMAPVAALGHTVGILSRSSAEHASKMGAGEMTVGELICGGAPRVARLAGPALMKKRSLGVAPGLIVSGPGGLMMGTISRHRVAQAFGAAGHKGRNLNARIRALMGEPRALLLRRAGALAGRRGVGLHLAGGVVRDLLMGTAPRDLDLVVEGDGIGFATQLARQLGGALTRHERFGTAVIRLASVAGDPATGLRIDVATARREIYEHPAALPAVEPGSIFDDIHRRDVTINSMTIRLDGRRFGILVDEIGGQRDLRRRALRVHHKMSLVDDPTRAFRIARFAARFGFTQTDDTRDSLTLARELGAFERLGGERLLRELLLIASEPEPGQVWRHCAANGLLSVVSPALRWDADARRLMGRFFLGIRHGRLEAISGLVDPALVMLMLLARGASRGHRKALAARLKMTGRPAARLDAFAEELLALTGKLSHQPAAGRVARLCEQADPEVLALAWTGGGPSAKAIDWYLRELRLVRPTITGEALREMGLSAGPGFALVLARLKAAILDGRVQSATEEREMALRLVRGRRRNR